ncbi:ATP-binding protein [Salinigranum sp. GCM10025319]|uniref:ATP-binding protein n=1 Tax=Salinigranum sp. GCM10025319 TaxID=3252687 RepID=UPI00361C2ED4
MEDTTFVETAPIPVWVQRAEEILEVNGAAVDFFGAQTRDELVGDSALDFVPETNRERVLERNREVMDSDESFDTVEGRLVTRDDEIRYGRFAAAPVQYADETAILVIAQDVTETRRIERILRRQNEQLEAFAGTVSHDLRNPLNVAEGNLELARAERDCDRLERVASSLDRMAGIIDELLMLATEGRAVEEAEPIELVDFARLCWGGVETGDATVTVADDVTFDADRVRMRHVFENLFRNAIEHGSISPRSQTHGDCVEHGSTGNRTARQSGDAIEHGSTTPRSQTHGDRVEHAPTSTRPAEDGGESPSTRSTVAVTVGTFDEGLYVADDGPGVPAEAREEVFESGYSTGETGAGLGLHIVRQMVEAHGWRIDVTDSDGGGARFEITGVTHRERES